MRRSDIHVYTYTYVHTHTHVCIHIYVHMYVYIHIFMRVCIYISASRLPSQILSCARSILLFFWVYIFLSLLHITDVFILLLHTLGRCGWKRRSVAHRSHSVRDQGQTRRARGYVRGILHSQSCRRQRAAGAPL